MYNAAAKAKEVAKRSAISVTDASLVVNSDLDGSVRYATSTIKYLVWAQELLDRLHEGRVQHAGRKGDLLQLNRGHLGYLDLDRISPT